MSKKAFLEKASILCMRIITSVIIVVLTFIDVSSIFYLSFDTVRRAEAATGDFSIFRESSGTETVATTTLGVKWDTTVSANSNISIQANESDIDLADGGKYLVLYNVWSEQGTSTGGGTNRRSQHTWISVGGVKQEYGHGGGYIRDNTDGGSILYNSGGAIIEASPGDDLQVHVERDDTNTTAGVNIRPDTNGISVLKLKDNWDYLRIHSSATSSNISGNTSFTDVAWDTSDEVDTGSFGFSPTSGDVTLKGDDNDHFLVTANVRLERASNNTRLNYEMRLTLDGVEVPGTRVTAYPRGNNNSNGIFYDTIVYTGIIQKDAIGDQILNVELRRESSNSATTNIMADQTALSIVALPDEGSYIMLTDSSTTSLASTRTAFDWDTQLEVDTAAFSHSTTSQASQININTAGNYLFFATLYATSTSGGSERQLGRIDWLKTGTAQNYGGHGFYVRDDQAFSGGSSGGILLDGLTASDYVAVSQHDEVEAPIDATFQGNRVAIQGILLDENFFGTDVSVSATSSHAIEADIPSVDFEMGGTFIITEKTSSRNVTDVTLTESGTVDAETGLTNIELYYDLDTTVPYNCVGETFSGTSTESKYGDTDTNGFSGPDGVVSFTDTVGISTTQTFCGYVIYDVTGSSTDGETVEISIADPSSDVGVSNSGSVGPLTQAAPTGSTTLRNAELTQTHFRWLSDDGIEGAATPVEDEDVSAIGFANGTVRRLRSQVYAAGSTSSPPTTFRLEYATKTAGCSALTSWVDVGEAGGAWDMSNSLLTEGSDASNIAVLSGGVSDPAGSPTFLSTNGGLRDVNSETSALTLASDEFVEFEFAVEPTATAPQGNTYCFRFSDAGTGLRNYDIYAEGSISADIDVSATSSQTVSVDVSTTNNYVGGGFLIRRQGGTRTVTDITITETGTVDGSVGLENIQLYYDLDITTPYDCTGESYGGGETQFGSTDVDGFSGANGSSTFTGSETVNNTRSMCLYVVLDTTATSTNGETINVEISDPSNDIVVTGSSVGPSSAVSPTGSTTISGPVLTQTHYHWRNDDGDESGATSATGGIEDTALTNVPKQSIRRLRMQVSNEGSVTSAATQYQLEYGTKLSTCDEVNTWVDVTSGAAFTMASTSGLTEGADTIDISTTTGGVSNENSVFLTPNGGEKEQFSTTSPLTLTSSEYLELEFAIEATDNAGFNTSYCFKLTDSGKDIAYQSYPELTTREKRDFFTQQGFISFTGTSTTLVAGVDYTAPAASSSAFVRITNSHMTGGGRDDFFDATQNADDVTAYIENPDDITNSITFARPSTASATTTVAWEILEFIGLAGTDNEMIVRDQGGITYGTSELFATGTVVDTVSDDSDVVVFITSQATPNASTEYYIMQTTSSWSPTSSVPVFERGDSSGNTATVTYAVVEFTGANWNVQRVEHTYTSDTVAETESIEPVGNPSRAFLHTQKRLGPGQSGLEELGHEVWISSMGNVSFQLDPGANNVSEHVSVAWVIENTQTGTGEMVVHQSSGSLAANPGACSVDPCIENISIGQTIGTLTNASIFYNNRSDGNGGAFPRPITVVHLISTTQYETWRSYTGQEQNFRTEVVEWPTAELSFRQSYYRFYVDNATITPSDPWPVGASDLGENESITSINDPLGEGEQVRIRMNILINNATLPELTKGFKLQFGKRDTTCSAIGSGNWTDLGAPGSGAVWRGFDGVPADGVELATSTPAPGLLVIGNSDVSGTYEEENNSSVNPYQVNITERIEYDWHIEQNGALQSSDYCFRMVESDNSELSGYDNYPTIRTSGYTPISANWQWYDDATNTTPTASMAAENTAPINVANNNVIKLRVTVSEVEAAKGNNVRFGLQYSEYADFSDGGTFLTGTSSCAENSLWCYSDAAGVDTATITASVLSDSDSCSGGVGSGCGAHNESTSTVSTLNQAASSNMEFEFALEHAGARVGTVYYFRLYDIANDDIVIASSTYPSLVTESGSLVFTMEGVSASTVTEGITTDVATTPTSIAYGSLPLDTEIEAAHRLSVDTNGTEGYKVLMYMTGDLTSNSGDIIDGVSATNDSPSGWVTGCSVLTDGCFGYHSGDDVLEGGSTRFAATDTYARLSSTTPEEVVYSSVPVEGQTEDIVYKLEVRKLQAAGQYETNIRYIAIPIF